MKTLITIVACSCVSLGSVMAQKAIQIPALIIDITDKPLNKGVVFIEAVKADQVIYRKKRNDNAPFAIKTKSISSVLMSRPQDFVDAVELFEKRDYEAALTAFKAIEEKYKNFYFIQNSFPALAGLYKLDCLRKLKQYKTLALEEPKFAGRLYLTKQSHADQIDIYKLWTHLNEKAYPKVIKEYADNWREKKLPNNLRAQVEFVYGKAQEAEGNPEEALIAYCKAMNADFAGSEVLTLEAVESSLNLIENDKEAQEIRALWDANKKDLIKPKLNTMPYRRLLEACALIKVHDKLGFSGFDDEGNIIKLPEKYNKYLKYTKEAGELFAKD